MTSLEHLKQTDTPIYDLIQKEIAYQQSSLRLIPSENYASLAVLEALGTPLSNKYAEGYPGKRYYGGNQYIDEIETLAIERAKKMLGAEHVNVQPHAGASANIAAFFALLELGDTFMGLELSQGGHLTHCSPVNFSGKWFKPVAYAVDKQTEKLDYDAIEKQAKEKKPKMIIAGYTAYPMQVDFKRFREICDSCDAYLLADISHFAGLVVGGVHNHPLPHADVVTSTTHKTLRGPRSAFMACKADLAKQVDKAVFPGLQGGPLENLIAAKAVCFQEAMQPSFKQYARQIVKNAKAMANELMAQGLRLVAGGTETHLLLVDLTSLNITGKEAQAALEEAGIIVNKNTIPFDTKSPFVTSGIRLGTPSLTTRGMKESEMKQIAQMLVKVLKDPSNAETKRKIRSEAEELCRQFPVYPELG